MSFIKKHKGKIITFILIISVLAFAFFYCDNNRTSKDFSPHSEPHIVKTFQSPTKSEKIVAESSQKTTNEEEIEQNKENLTTNEIQQTTPPDSTEAVETTEPIETTELVEITEKLTCTLSIRCDNAIGELNGKSDILPTDGIILHEKSLEFFEGETVFNILVRELKKNMIHLEFVNVPLYNSAYIEGIANLYEFDCGELSGWMYKVNGWFPNYGCSRYQLKAGDRVEWVYTCDLGADVGGNYSARNGK